VPDDALAGLEAARPALEARFGEARGEPEVLGGGITNHNVRVRLGGRDCVVRLAGRDTALLGIDRECERLATAAAAATGIGPEVLGFLEDPECLVTGFIPGRLLAQGDLTRPDALAEVAVALSTVHEGPALPCAFSPFAVIDAYRETAAARGAPVPGGFGDLREGARAVERAIDPGHPEHAPVPCHNDLLAANFLHDGERLRILDWEYAGMGNRYFDLGNLSVNNAFSEAGDEWLLECYWGEAPTRHRFAAVRLMRIVSDFREAMWGVLQGAISELEFDFAAYAEEHLERVKAGFSDPRFAVWLQDAHGP
jgi:thiamine kinase-like enzyme